MDTEKKTIGQFLKGYMKQSLDVLRHPIRLLPTILIGIIWMVLGLLASKSELILPLKMVSFLTFAQGGLYGGFFGAIGGIVGKVVVAAFVNSLIMPLFDKRQPFQGFSQSFSNMFSSMSMDSARGVAPLFYGAGAALLLYGLMNLTQTGHNAMVGIVAAVMLLQNIGNRGGFMFGLLFAAANSLTKGRTPSYMTVTRALTGMTFGFSFGVVLSVVGFHYSPLFAIPLLIGGILCTVIGKSMSSPSPVAASTTPPPPPPPPTAALLLCFLLLPATLSAQRKEGTWVEPVQYFHFDKKSNYLDLDGIADAMWEKERYIMGFKATVCNVTPIGDDPEKADVPFNPLTFYVYLNEPTTVTTVSDWRGLSNGEYLGIYQLTASSILFTYDKNTHRYSFDYDPAGSYDYDDSRARAKHPNSFSNGFSLSEHRSVMPDKAEMSLFYTHRGGLRGYYEVALLQEEDEIDKQMAAEDATLSNYSREDIHYVQFTIDEVLLDGDVGVLSEEDRVKLIEQMDNLTQTLKEYMEETGDHTGPIPTSIINMIGTIGGVLIGSGVASATGGAAGGIFGGGGGGGPTGGGGGAPTPDTPSDGMPPEPQKKEEDEEEPSTPPEEEPEPEDPLGENRAYWDKYMKENPDGTLTMKDPITGKPLTYYPTADGGYESEMGTNYTKESLAENVRYRYENSSYFKDVGDKAAKDVAEQRAQIEKQNAETDARGQAYREQKAAEEAAAKEAAEKKKAQLERLAQKYGVEANEDKVYEALQTEQSNAEEDYKQAQKDAEFYDRAYSVAETVDKVATTTINIMGECVPGGGRVVKNIYTMAHSVASTTSQAYNTGGDMGKAILTGAIDGGIGVLQNQAGDIASNAWTEGIMVVGGESIKEGLKSIANGDTGDQVCDKMLSSATHKLNYFLAGKQAEKALGWMNKSASQSLNPNGVTLAEDTGLRLSEGAAKSISKVLGTKEGMDGMKAAYQEIGQDYAGNWGRDSKVDGVIHDVQYFTDLVKDFSNAASKAKNS